MARLVPLLVIAGPTAARKTEAAVRVARCVGGEIISADSMQIYRRLDIGTAKPTPAQRAQVRFHLVDCVEPDQPYTVADFQRQARETIVEVWGRGHLPILCGGTGLYIRALLRHYVFPPGPPRPPSPVRIPHPEAPPGAAVAEGVRGDGVSRQRRRQLERLAQELGAEGLHRRLAEVDPVSAARIPPANIRRVIRALEAFELTGLPMSQAQRVDAHPAVQYNARGFVVTCPRPVLHARIEARIDAMMDAGWLAEVQALKAQGYSPALQSLQAIGYRHILQWLAEQQEIEEPGSLEELVALIKRDTRRYAKRQLTWFRREPDLLWREWADEEGFRQVVSEMSRTAVGLLDSAGRGERIHGLGESQ